MIIIFQPQLESIKLKKRKGFYLTADFMCCFYNWWISPEPLESCLSPGVEPDPGTEGRQEPHPAGADASGGGGA